MQNQQHRNELANMKQDLLPPIPGIIEESLSPVTNIGRKKVRM